MEIEIRTIAEQPASEIQMMDESLEFIFTSMIRQGDAADAIDFVKSLDVNIMPSKTVLRTIIFEILMKSKDARCLALSSDYLVTILNAFPPKTEDLRMHYYDSIRDCQGYLDDLWSVFSHIVNSFFYHRSIYDIERGENRIEPIKYPNCKFLLEYYVKLFSMDFEYLYVKNFQPCLMMLLVWRNHNICLCNRTDMILKWVNDIYSNPCVNSMGDLLECMHDMLTLMVKCFFQAKFNMSELNAFRHPCLVLEIVDSTMNFCKNAFTNQENVKLFLMSLTLKSFQARVSERIIKQITRQVSKRTYVSTLKDIVYQCMFPQKLNKWKNTKPTVNTEKNLRKRVPEKEKKTIVASSDKKIETTRLHELVKKNKFGDLYQAIHESPEDINAKDSTGCTPLHEACQAGNYMSVKVLLNESKKDLLPNLDITVTNSEGLTALHLAVKANSIGIVKELLSVGASDVLNVRDDRGYKPIDWSTSEEMRKLLQEHQLEFPSNESDTITEDNLIKEAPNLKSFREYSIYLQALTCLLGTYCELFNVYDYVWKKMDMVKSHAAKLCCHYSEEDVCSEDAAIASQMPDLIATFIESVQRNVQKLRINVDIELIPLKAFSASLISS